MVGMVLAFVGLALGALTTQLMGAFYRHAWLPVNPTPAEAAEKIASYMADYEQSADYDGDVTRARAAAQKEAAAYYKWEQEDLVLALSRCLFLAFMVLTLGAYVLVAYWVSSASLGWRLSFLVVLLIIVALKPDKTRPTQGWWHLHDVVVLLIMVSLLLPAFR